MPSRFLLPCAAAALMLSSAAFAQKPAPTEAEPIGYDELHRGQNQAAIAEINGNGALRLDDPARSINLAVAHAREGLVEEARSYFEAALSSAERLELETAAGEWIDSRELARQGLRKLARGDFDQGTFASLR